MGTGSSRICLKLEDTSRTSQGPILGQWPWPLSGLALALDLTTNRSGLGLGLGFDVAWPGVSLGLKDAVLKHLPGN